MLTWLSGNTLFGNNIGNIILYYLSYLGAISQAPSEQRLFKQSFMNFSDVDGVNFLMKLQYDNERYWSLIRQLAQIEIIRLLMPGCWPGAIEPLKSPLFIRRKALPTPNSSQSRLASYYSRIIFE